MLQKASDTTFVTTLITESYNQANYTYLLFGLVSLLLARHGKNINLCTRSSI